MRYVAVEQARKQLGKLVQDAAAGEVITIGRRGADQVVLLSEVEYARLRRLEEAAAQQRFQEALAAISASVAEAGLSETEVKEAIGAVRATSGPT
jgi:prevent-host-death family protein